MKTLLKKVKQNRRISICRECVFILDRVARNGLYVEMPFEWSSE